MHPDDQPHFSLESQYEDGAHGPPRIVPVGSLPPGMAFGRRHLFGLGATAAALLPLLDRDAAAAETAATAPSLKAHAKAVTALRFLPDGRLVTAGKDNLLKIWQVLAHATPVRLPPRPLEVTALEVSADGAKLVAGVADKSIQLIDLPAASAIGLLPVPASFLNGLARTPDGSWFASGAWDHTVRLWAFPGGQPMKSLSGHMNYVTAVAFSPDGAALASGSWDGSVRLWSVPDGEPRGVLKGHHGYVEHLVSLADPPRLLSGSRDGTVRVWSFSEAGQLLTFEPGAGPIRALAASPDGSLLAVAAGDQMIRLFRLPDGAPAGKLEGHHALITALAFRDQGVLASGDESGSVILWQPGALQQFGFLFDQVSNTQSGSTYNRYDRVTGTTISSTLACGSPIPPGAVCACNCVPGALAVSPTTRQTGATCRCDQVCTCVPVRTPGSASTRRRCVCVPVMTRC